MMDTLEDRTVPTVLDLTGGTTSGIINGALYQLTDPDPTGSGKIHSFVRLHSNTGSEQGYNTSGRPLQFDENNSPVFTHDLPLSSVPTVTVGGVTYREFLLDMNDPNKASSQPITLDQVKIFLGSQGGLNPSDISLLGTLIYNMDGVEESSVLMKDVNSGSGQGDMFLLVPNSLFTGGTFVYLYSEFSDTQGGFEEWAVGPNVNLLESTIHTNIHQGATDNGNPVIVTGQTVPAGSVVHDSSTVTGAQQGPTPTGTVTYSFFNLDVDPNVPVYTTVVNLNPDGSVPESDFSLALVPGHYSYSALYSGDASYAPDTSEDEPLTVTFNISGVKFRDNNGDGILTPAEGDAGWDSTKWGTVTIQLWKENDNVAGLSAGDTLVDSTNPTDGTGAYSFADLDAGIYYVKEIVPDLFSQAAPTSYYTIDSSTVTQATVTGQDFANQPTSSNVPISGTKFTDGNGDGLGDGQLDNSPLGNVTITLWFDTDENGLFDDGLDTVINGTATPKPEISLQLPGSPVLTAGDGTYTFNLEFDDIDLVEGQVYTFFVVETVPPGYTQTWPAPVAYHTVSFSRTGTVVSVVGDGVADKVSGFDFANFQNVSISGTKFNDLNGDQNIAADSPVTGTTFTIGLYKWVDTAENPGVVDPDELTLITTTETSSANGTYSFENLGPLGTGEKYFVQEEGETGWTQTFGNAGYVVDASSGNNATGKDFGNFQNINISGTKYQDVNGDDTSATIGTGDDVVLNSANSNYVSVTIYLYKDGGVTPFATTTTDADGNFSFTDLGPGSYLVSEEVPTGWAKTAETGATIVAESGQNSTGNNFANALGSISWEKRTTGGAFIPVAGTYFTVSPNPLVNGVGTFTVVDNGANDADPTIGVIKIVNVKLDGTYTVTETVPPAGYLLDVNPSRTVTGPTAGNLNVSIGVQGVNDVGETNASDFHDPKAGQSATIGFWQNKNGKAVVAAMGTNASGYSKVGIWLANNFPNLYTGLTGAKSSTASMTPTELLAYYYKLFSAPVSQIKLEAQVMCTAISVYVTDVTLNSSATGQATAAKYGFSVSAGGLGAQQWNVGANGSVLGLTNNTYYSVMAILQAANNNAVGGKLFASNVTKRSAANTIFTGINEYFDI